jgi:L,D-transpeptidase catalytic domain
MIKKIYLSLSSIFIFILQVPFVFAKTKPVDTRAIKPGAHSISASFNGNNPLSNNQPRMYDSLKLDTLGLSRQAFDYALKGFNYLKSLGKVHNDTILSIVDFSLPSSKKRLFVIDLTKCTILFNTYVAHGRNSGKEYANQFSNKNESNKSSLGFYVTQDTYTGNHGYSLRLEGEENGINDNALNRAIVMHSAWYVDESIIKSRGYIGRSLGCPVIPESLRKPIIEKIKNGSCLFLYSPDQNYLSHSTILRQTA